MARDLPTLTLHELADGVFVWLQPGGESGVSNAGVVVDEDGLTVIDTLMVPDQWRPFAEAVQRLGLPVRRVVLTHAHIDHVGGTSAFRSAKVLASPLTSELLDQTMPLDAYKAFMPAFRDGFDELAAIGTRPVSHIVDDAAALTPRIEVLPASGHTAGDLVVLVDDADVLFAGDLCFFGVTPLAFQGDVAQWAAVLGAIGEGDIGQFFPNTDPRWKGAPSRTFLEEAARQVKLRNGRLVNVDASLIAQAPKLMPHVVAMKTHIATALGLDPKKVGIKATTNEKMGFIGREEGIAAMAVASVDLPE